MNCVITSANIFSGQSAVTSRIFPVQSAVSVRKSTPGRPFIPFICPIILRHGTLASCLTQTEDDVPAFYDKHHKSLEFSLMSGRLYDKQNPEFRTKVLGRPASVQR